MGLRSTYVYCIPLLYSFICDISLYYKALCSHSIRVWYAYIITLVLAIVIITVTINKVE